MFDFFKSKKMPVLILAVIMLTSLFALTAFAQNDAKPAIFFQSVDDELKAWWMDGEEREASEVFASVEEAGWQAKALADMNGDGHPDIYWLNEDGRLKVWLMEGLEHVDTVYPLNPATGQPEILPVWDMMAVADLNGSGSPDIIWQALEGDREGDLAIWLMDGLEADRYGKLFNHPGVAKVSPLWEIGAVFDLLGDGQPEVLWQSVSGEAFDQLAYWQLDVEGDEFTRSASARLTHVGDRAEIKSEWRMKAAVDLMGDDKYEIIFQGIAGDVMDRVSYWVMDGPARIDGGRLMPDTVSPGWTIFGAAMALDEEIIPTFTVTFVDYDDSVIDTQVVEQGEDAVAPADPVREGYEFIGWDTDFTNVTEDLTVKALYEIKTYTVEFVDWDGTEIEIQIVEHGSDAVAPADPVREGYDFIGWDTDFTNVTGDLTVTAEYELITFMVTFDVTPADAAVTFDGEPYTEPVAVVPGTYEYSVEKEGYYPEEGTVEVVDEDVTVVVELELITFMVSFEVTPEDATVTFDGAPYTEPVEVVPGTYDYRVEKLGYVPEEGTIEVVDEDVTKMVALSRVTAKDLGVEFEDIVDGVFNVVVPFDAAAEMLGATENSTLLVHVPGKDPLMLAYNADRTAFFKANVQSDDYTQGEIENALVSVALQAKDLGVSFEDLAPGVFNIVLPFASVEEELGATEQSTLVLYVAGKDPVQLTYNADRVAFFKGNVQADDYSKAEIEDAFVILLLPGIPAEELGVVIDELVPGAFNVAIPFAVAEQELGALKASTLVMAVSGKDPIELTYNADRDAFFKGNVQGYSEAEITGSLVSIK